MEFKETCSNGTCPTCGKNIDWGQEYCNNCRPSINGVYDYDFYCNVDDTEWSSPNENDIYCPKCGRRGVITGTPNTKR